MRTALALLLMTPAPALAWDFSPSPVCTLSHSTEEAEVVITYDPRRAEAYEISVLLAFEPWEEAPVFAMAFTGGRGLIISTDRHARSPDGTRLTVSDTGFGNLLDGLQFNAMAQALNGSQSFEFNLAGAAEDVAAFRACTATGTV